MNREHARYVRYLINRNGPLVANSAISHCHCLGLHSFVISQDPKVRLFIADDDCEIHTDSGVIPIHSHKYDDYFQVISGAMFHSIHDFSNNGRLYNSYTYRRIGDTDEQEIVSMGQSMLSVVDVIAQENLVLPANRLHSVRLSGSNVMWTLTELERNVKFNQICYKDGELKRRDELYKPMPNAVEFIESRLKLILGDQK